MKRQFHESKNTRTYIKVSNLGWDIYFKSRSLYDFSDTVNLYVDIWNIYDDLHNVIFPYDTGTIISVPIRYCAYK